ncbi:MAG: formyltransferase [Betaproteobacteria bacterium]|nr:formyltransferase [Betaproteobacteria bacterium]
MPRAVVFAYHNVGVRCLSVLLAQGVEVPLVVTHEDSPNETIWFDSVATLAKRHGIATIAPADPNVATVFQRLRALRPEFFFSFYYRHMLGADLLAIPTRGALNMHGSLLPKYRGRVPVNWAIVHGEAATGATLHEMVAKPDAGRLVDQLAVPILPNDTAHEVFGKVTVAAEIVLSRALASIVDGTVRPLTPDLQSGSYFGGRKPADGRIDWSKDAWTVHNLVRAVAPPYPGAFAELHGRRLAILQTWWQDERSTTTGAPILFVRDHRIALRCNDGGLLDVLRAEVDGHPLTPDSFSNLFGSQEIPLP